MKLNQIQILPRYILELSLILMLILTAYIMRLNDISIEKIFTFIALLLASAFRVMPSMTKYKFISNDKFSLSCNALINLLFKL